MPRMQFGLDSCFDWRKSRYSCRVNEHLHGRTSFSWPFYAFYQSPIQRGHLFECIDSLDCSGRDILMCLSW